MNINAEPGTKVRFLGNVTNEQIRWGGHSDPRGLLMRDQSYTVQKTIVHSWHTKIYLEEFPDRSFNSVWFTEIKLD